MFIDIEVTSGKILDLLDDKGKLNFYEIKSTTNAPELLITMSLQWLTEMGFIIEDIKTKKYAINDLQRTFKREEQMVG